MKANRDEMASEDHGWARRLASVTSPSEAARALAELSAEVERQAAQVAIYEAFIGALDRSVRSLDDYTATNEWEQHIKAKRWAVWAASHRDVAEKLTALATAAQPSAGSHGPVVLWLTERADSIKALRETFCTAQFLVNQSPYDRDKQKSHSDRLQRLIDECDRQRPLASDGKHGNRHTPTCGCDVPPAA